MRTWYKRPLRKEITKDINYNPINNFALGFGVISGTMSYLSLEYFRPEILTLAERINDRSGLIANVADFFVSNPGLVNAGSSLKIALSAYLVTRIIGNRLEKKVFQRCKKDMDADGSTVRRATFLSK